LTPHQGAFEPRVLRVERRGRVDILGAERRVPEFVDALHRADRVRMNARGRTNITGMHRHLLISVAFESG
jgi:hypothetical protein